MIERDVLLVPCRYHGGAMIFSTHYEDRQDKFAEPSHHRPASCQTH
ncbi:hypothetical protein [Sporisorium scitamineum]|uniref:Uncharacterized protein n=1 Tax=Sporisorium scitamineum TaxID=49012 RepID=A0A0F7RYW2_9BASI|nr:hypothetical protein [Sporisorium scitamineum]